MNLEELELLMPVTRVDSLSGIYRIAKLKKHWPFQDIPGVDSERIGSMEEKLANELVLGHAQWPDAMDSLYNYYLDTHELNGAATVLQTLVLEYPDEPSLYEKTAMLFGQMNDLANAAFYFRKSFALSPSAEKARYLFVIYFKLDSPAEAMPYLDYSIRNSSQAAAFVAIKSLAGEIMELQRRYELDSADRHLPIQIAELYLKMGNKEIAERYALKVLEADSRNRDAQSLLARVKKNG
jgi:predicted Zn-dependent protease